MKEEVMQYSNFYIDYSNKKQVEWWNKIGCVLVTVFAYQEIIDVDTNKPVGSFIHLKKHGFRIFNNYVTKKMQSFIKESK